MEILVTGVSGFIAKNLRVRLSELSGVGVRLVGQDMDDATLRSACSGVDVVFHLAGVNRPRDTAEFVSGNVTFTRRLCACLVSGSPNAAILFSSSSQAALDNAYGASKRAAEDVLEAHAQATGARVYIYRLPNVFGKWSQPNYNSAVATFCHNVANGLPITINDPSAELSLVHVDDVIDAFFATTGLVGEGNAQGQTIPVAPVHRASVGEIAALIESFRNSRSTLITEQVGTGFARALYATYVSFLPSTAFSYAVPKYEDPRGLFAEMLKTKDSGQFSFFTAHPGVTRGGHYHHSKTEKFLVIKGQARFKFRHLLTDERVELCVDAAQPTIVETIPGWVHDITNTGPDEMVVMLWANEIFDRSRPDTVAAKV